MKIALDCDGILSDFVSAAQHYAAGCGCERTIDQIKGWDIWGQWDLKHLERDFQTWLERTRACAHFAQYPHAKDLVAGLRELGEVVIVTGPYEGVKHWIDDRIDWLKENFGFRPDEVCVWSQKHWIDADVLIDDGFHNVKAFREKRKKPSVLVRRPWNKDEPPTPGIFVRDDQHVTRTVACLRQEMLQGI